MLVLGIETSTPQTSVALGSETGVVAASLLATGPASHELVVSEVARALDRAVSISRVRGQRFEIQGRTVIPTFHPAAILHGGGESSSQMAAIRSDFATIRRVLDEPVPVPVAAEEQLGLF